MTSKAFVDAIQNARTIMNYGNKLGFEMNLLDIGGGFPGNSGTEDYFAEIATAINAVLEEHFPDDGNIRIIAEPGRYYVASAYSLATNVIATRETLNAGLSISLLQLILFLFQQKQAKCSICTTSMMEFMVRSIVFCMIIIHRLRYSCPVYVLFIVENQTRDSPLFF